MVITALQGDMSATKINSAASPLNGGVTSPPQNKQRWWQKSLCTSGTTLQPRAASRLGLSHIHRYYYRNHEATPWWWEKREDEEHKQLFIYLKKTIHHRKANWKSRRVSNTNHGFELGNPCVNPLDLQTKFQILNLRNIPFNLFWSVFGYTLKKLLQLKTFILYLLLINSLNIYWTCTLHQMP